MLPITAIVVSFNTKGLTRRCLLSLTNVDEIIVVDNNSQDGSCEMIEEEFPSVVLIKNSDNRGFGAANNQALTIAKNPLALLINSDAATVDSTSVQKLFIEMESPDVVAVGGRLVSVSPTGEYVTQLSACRELTLWRLFCEQTGIQVLFRGSFLDSYWVSSEVRIEVDQVMGACLLMRTRELFDERFFLYCEDTELCLRLRARGKIVYEPGAMFLHELGASTTGNRWRGIAFYNRGKELYFQIHHGPFASFMALLINRLGAVLRLVGAGVMSCVHFGHPHYTEKVNMFAKVLFAPISGPKIR